MAEIDDLKNDYAALKADITTFITNVGTQVAGLTKQIADLQAQIAAGGSIDPADVEAIATDMLALDATVKAATPPAPATDPNAAPGT